MLLVARLFADDVLSPLVYSTGGDLVLAFASYQNNCQEHICLSVIRKKTQTILSNRDIQGVAKVCRVDEKGSRGFYRNQKRNVRAGKSAIYNSNLHY